MSEWKPIETAPLDTNVLLWWVGAPGNGVGPKCSFGQVASNGEGVWTGDYYIPLKFYTHWMPCPGGPTVTPTDKSND